jgi:hypothetical protein
MPAKCPNRMVQKGKDRGGTCPNQNRRRRRRRRSHNKSSIPGKRVNLAQRRRRKAKLPDVIRT